MGLDGVDLVDNVEDRFNTSIPDSAAKIRKIGCAGTAAVLLILACTAFYFSSIGRHLRFYGEAEQIVDEMIIPFRNELLQSKGTPQTLINLPHYAELKQRATTTELGDGECIRFHINDMFDIGVMDDGGINWHVH